MSNDLTRPIIGIENRTAQEVFDIMCDRFRRSPSPSPAPVVVEAGAQKIASWLGFAWDGLYEGSVVAKGFPIFTHGQFGWHFQGYKDDLRNLARDILALASLSQPAKGAVVGLDEWEGQITDGAELASAERNRAARIASASPAKGEREGGE